MKRLPLRAKGPADLETLDLEVSVAQATAIGW